jgi:hypothetical protein
MSHSHDYPKFSEKVSEEHQQVETGSDLIKPLSHDHTKILSAASKAKSVPWGIVPKKEWQDWIHESHPKISESPQKMSTELMVVPVTQKPDTYEHNPKMFDELVEKLAINKPSKYDNIDITSASRKELMGFGHKLLNDVKKDVELVTGLLGLDNTHFGKTLKRESKKIINTAHKQVAKTVHGFHKVKTQLLKEHPNILADFDTVSDALNNPVSSVSKSFRGHANDQHETVQNSMDAASKLIDAITWPLPDGPHDAKRSATDLMKRMTKTIITTDFNDKKSVKKSIYSFRDGYRNAVKNIVKGDDMSSEEKKIIDQADKVMDFFTNSVGSMIDEPQHPVEAWFYPAHDILTKMSVNLQEMPTIKAIHQSFFPEETNSFPPEWLLCIAFACFILLCVAFYVKRRQYKKKIERVEVPDREFVRMDIIA